MCKKGKCRGELRSMPRTIAARLIAARGRRQVLGYYRIVEDCYVLPWNFGMAYRGMNNVIVSAISLEAFQVLRSSLEGFSGMGRSLYRENLQSKSSSRATG